MSKHHYVHPKAHPSLTSRCEKVVQEVERERDEAQAEVKRLREALKRIHERSVYDGDNHIQYEASDLLRAMNEMDEIALAALAGTEGE